MLLQTDDFEYYIESSVLDGEVLVWPSGAPQVVQTAVVTAL